MNKEHSLEISYETYPGYRWHFQCGKKIWLGYGALQQQEMKAGLAQAESCCVYVKPEKFMQHMDGIIPQLFDCWANHLLLIKSSTVGQNCRKIQSPADIAFSEQKCNRQLSQNADFLNALFGLSKAWKGNLKSLV